MRVDALLLGLAVVAIIATVSLVLLVPGFVADPSVDEEPVRLMVEESTISVAEVTGETATFDVTAYVRHAGGTPENVTVEVRATDEASGLLVDTTRRSMESFDDDGEQSISVPVTVPREGSYTITSILYVDGERTDVARSSVHGVEALTPPHADSAIEFHDFFARPSLEYTIVDVENDSVTLSVISYLTNTGDTAESGLELEITARQSDANVIAAREETSIGTIDAGRTTPTEVTLTVPDGYNYYLDATLWRDGVVIDSTIAAANLDPRETFEVNETREPVQFEAGDFEVDRAEDPLVDRMEELEEDQPGFGPVVALVGIGVGLSLFAIRRRLT